ncbi:MAG: ATP-binding protein [Thermoplasmata archaeon]
MSEDVYEKLAFYNHWWSTGEVKEGLAKSFKRSLFNKLVERLDYPRILAILGPRRVGKTTLMYQLIQHLLSNKNVDPKHVLYITMDEIGVENLDELFDTYQRFVLMDEIGEEEVYFFIDEIQFMDDWQLMLKKYFDQKLNINFVVSGSSSMDITKGTSDSLVGRIDEHILLPFSFNEYTHFNRENTLPDDLTLSFNYDDLQSLYGSLLEHKKILNIVLNQYLLEGGFPEVNRYDDLMLKYEYIWKDIFEKVVYKDIPSVFNIRDPKLLRSLLEIVAKETCQNVSYTNLSNDLNAKRETISKYLSYLESAYLIDLSTIYSKSKVKEQRANKKVYLTDIILKNALLRTTNLSNRAELGKSVETIVYNHLKNISRKNMDIDISYWRERNKEVDIIFEDGEETIPIEVKYQNDISKEDLRGVIHFCKKFGFNKGFVINKDGLDKKTIDEIDIIFIPLWFFLAIAERKT